jgi:hypothetical protein
MIVTSCSAIARIVAALLGIAALMPLADDRQLGPAEPHYSEVYVAGERGYNTLSITSVIATRRGTLLAFA